MLRKKGLLDPEIPEGVLQIIEGMLDPNPLTRISAGEAFQLGEESGLFTKKE